MPLLNQKNSPNQPIILPNPFWTILILILLTGNVFFGFKYFAFQKELQKTQTALEIQKTNGKILEFSGLFIEKVLQAEKEIDFETRLKLENAVRNLEDEEILTQWQKFTESKTEIEAQREVKNLLEMLMDKIEIQ